MATRTPQKTAQMWIGNFPADLKQRISDLAAAEGTSFNTLAVRLLAQEFRVRFDEPGRSAPPSGPSAKVSLTMPHALRTKINVRAAQQDRRDGAAGLALEILRERSDVLLSNAA